MLGYHGCDEVIRRQAVSRGLALEQSDKDYDWLGPGIYFRESDPHRALEWAKAKVTEGSVKNPFVIGAVIDLGHCVDLLVREDIELLSVAYQSFAAVREAGKLPIPENRDPRGSGRGDKLLRFRDCAVIRHLHAMIESEEFTLSGREVFDPFDTVRGLFVEGEPAYPGGGFYDKTHTQIAVRNDRCIKGLFLPRDMV